MLTSNNVTLTLQKPSQYDIVFDCGKDAINAVQGTPYLHPRPDSKVKPKFYDCLLSVHALGKSCSSNVSNLRLNKVLPCYSLDRKVAKENDGKKAHGLIRVTLVLRNEKDRNRMVWCSCSRK